MNNIKINGEVYDYKLFDTFELIKLIKNDNKFIILFTETIKKYRNH